MPQLTIKFKKRMTLLSYWYFLLRVTSLYILRSCFIFFSAWFSKMVQLSNPNITSIPFCLVSKLSVQPYTISIAMKHFLTPVFLHWNKKNRDSNLVWKFEHRIQTFPIKAKTKINVLRSELGTTEPGPKLTGSYEKQSIVAP